MAKKNLLHLTENHTGKMEGFASLSTCCLNNTLCMTRKANKETICSHCYASAMLKRYSNLTLALQNNTEILTTRVLSNDELPVLNYRFFRLEAFGDLNNGIQVINYFNLCKKNPDTDFALWTKNPWLIAQVIKEGNEKPGNLNIIFSSIFTNKVNTVVANRYDFIDKVFTVYDKNHAQEVEINCGSKKCMDCKRCYRHHEGPVEYINELVK